MAPFRLLIPLNKCWQDLNSVGSSSSLSMIFMMLKMMMNITITIIANFFQKTTYVLNISVVVFDILAIHAKNFQGVTDILREMC